MLSAGSPAGWSCIVIGCGVASLIGAWVIRAGVEFQVRGTTIVLATVGIVLVAIGVVYLTRTAEDLPRLFPGHNGGSQHYRVLEGVVSLMFASLVSFGAVASTDPHARSR